MFEVKPSAENVDSLLTVAEAQWIPQTPGFEDLMTAKKNSKVTVNGLVFQVLDTKDAAEAAAKAYADELINMPGRFVVYPHLYFLYICMFVTILIDNE